MKYRKKPVVIEAKHFDGSEESASELVMWAPDWVITAARINGLPDSKWSLRIKTLEGDMVAKAGDWIIRGVKDEYYPCKPDIFEATYEAV